MADFFLPADIEEIVAEVGDAASEFAGRTVVLAGGCGFLGRYFTAVFAEMNRSCLLTPCRVVVLDNLITSGGSATEYCNGPHVEYVHHDVAVPMKVDYDVDFVINAAGIASPKYYSAYPLATLDATILGNRNLLDLALEHGSRFTFFSSSEIYGDPDAAHVPTAETYRGNVATQGRRACYDEGKRVGETLCYVFHSYYGVPTTVLRPFNVYGPGMNENDYRVLPNFGSNIKAGRPLHVYGNGTQTRTFCYVTDAINGFLRAIARGKPGETYNIGNPAPEIGMIDLVGRVEAAIGRPIDYVLSEYPDSYPADEPNRRCPDIAKARSELQFEPKVDLDTGLARFFAWSDRAYRGITDDEVVPA